MNRVVVAVVALLALAGCETYSISNSGYPGDGNYNAFYRGELSEMDVLVPDADADTSDARIAAILAARGPVMPARESPLLVVQSGALVPDSEMMRLIGAHFAAAPFSGIPPQDGAAYARRLRLAAAQGGFAKILVYWGALEVARDNEAGKAVSWIPIFGMAVPDETQKMRIVLKAAVIDVATARWQQIIPEPVEDARLSSSIDRGEAHDEQVRWLKEAGYARLVELLVNEADEVAQR